MDTVLLLARLVLAAVFAFAAVTKLADLSGSRAAMRGFGVPERLAGPAGVALPVAELAIAVLLLPLATAWWGALGALALLLAFVGGIAWNMSQGRAPECHCFGQVHSEPVGWPTLARNGVLAMIAVFVVAQGPDDAGASLTGWWGDLSGGERAGIGLATLALAVTAGVAWLAYHLLQQNGRLLLRIDALEAAVATGVAHGQPTAPAPAPNTGLATGAAAPEFTLPSLTGANVSLTSLRTAGKPVLLFFTDPGCGPCTALLPEIAQWQQEHGSQVTMALVSRGTAEANRTKLGELAISPVLLQPGSEVSEAYNTRATPSAVLVGPDGRIASEAAVGAEKIRALVTLAVTQPLPARSANGNGAVRPSGVPVGEAAPAVSLPDLDGAAITLADFEGQDTLVLFWNPTCGFCRRMLDDLKAWEADPPAGAPKALVVSTGTPEANREQGFQSPVVLDQGFTTGRAFGAGGTPSAVLVDAEGKVASPVAVGADAVFTLAGGRSTANT